MSNIGFFNMSKHMDKLYEAINVDKVQDEGIVIPDESRKAYDWLRKECDSTKQEVKVEMKLGDTKFDPKYDMQSNIDTSNSEFKPGIFGNTLPKKTKSGKETDFKPNDFTSKPTQSIEKDTNTTKQDEGETKDESTADYKKTSAKVLNK